MKVGLSTLYMIGTPFEELLREMERRSHVKYWEVADEDTHRLNEERVKQLKELAGVYDFRYAVHAPFADMNLASFNERVRKVVLEEITRSMELSWRLEAEMWVFHPGVYSGLSDIYPLKTYEINEESLKIVKRKAEELGISIAMENMVHPFGLFSKLEHFRKFYKPDLAEIAFDVGHANLTGEVYDFLEEYGAYIAHVHAHDNFGDHDSHKAIGNGNIDWERVLRMLKDLGFGGMIIVESREKPLKSYEKLKKLAYSL